MGAPIHNSLIPSMWSDEDMISYYSNGMDLDTTTGKPLRMTTWDLKRLVEHQHPMSAQYSATSVPTTSFTFVSPSMEQEDAVEYLIRNPGADRFSMVASIAHELKYLHEHNIVHGDLKQENVLIDSNKSVALRNFGVSHIIDPCGPENGLGSIRYAAPELVDGSTNYRNAKSDIYSFASVAVEILSGVEPFAYTISEVDIVMSLYHKDLPYHIPEKLMLGNPVLEQNFWDLMKSCWGDPDDRPDIHKVCDRLAEMLARDVLGYHRARL